MGLLLEIISCLIGSDTTTYGREYDTDQFKPRRPVDNCSNGNTSNNYNRDNYNSSTLMRGPQNNNKQ